MSIEREFAVMRVEDLQPADWNPRKIDKHRMDGLATREALKGWIRMAGSPC